MTTIANIKVMMWTKPGGQNHILYSGSITVGVEVVAHVIEEEVAEVGEEVVFGEVVAASSRESALPKFQQRPPNGAHDGVAVGDVAGKI